MKKQGLFGACLVFIVGSIYAKDISYLYGKRFNQVSFVEMHNISRHYEAGWPYPSPTGDQNLTVPLALELAHMEGAILSLKVPAHWTQDLGQCRGNGPIMAAHGMYRRTFDDDYLAEGKKLAEVADRDIENEFARLASIPGVAEVIAPLRKKYEIYKGIAFGYLYWSKPIANMDRVARTMVYGSNEKAALVPFTPCVVDPSAYPFIQLLSEIKLFLDTYREQMVVLKIENVTHSTEIISQLIQESGIAQYAHKQHKNELWPTIGELISQNKRIVLFITTHVSDEEPYLNAESDFIWSTHYNFQTKAELLADHSVPTDNPNYQRWITGKPVANALYCLPCHLTQGFGGRPDLAREINTKEVITERMHNIGKGNPTFLTLDYIDIGRGFEMVQEWNEQREERVEDTMNSSQRLYAMMRHRGLHS